MKASETCRLDSLIESAIFPWFSIFQALHTLRKAKINNFRFLVRISRSLQLIYNVMVFRGFICDFETWRATPGKRLNLLNQQWRP